MSYVGRRMKLTVHQVLYRSKKIVHVKKCVTDISCNPSVAFFRTVMSNLPKGSFR